MSSNVCFGSQKCYKWCVCVSVCSVAYPQEWCQTTDLSLQTTLRFTSMRERGNQSSPFLGFCAKFEIVGVLAYVNFYEF